jgi:hypothetical protein
MNKTVLSIIGHPLQVSTAFWSIGMSCEEAALHSPALTKESGMWPKEKNWKIIISGLFWDRVAIS